MKKTQKTKQTISDSYLVFQRGRAGRSQLKLLDYPTPESSIICTHVFTLIAFDLLFIVTIGKCGRSLQYKLALCN